MQIDTGRTTHQLLREFAKWQDPRDNGLGYPHIEPHERLRNPNNGSCDLSDDEAIIVDGILARLQVHKPSHYRVVCAHYLDGKPIGVLAKILGCHRSTVTTLIKRGVEWIDGARYGAGEKLL